MHPPPLLSIPLFLRIYRVRVSPDKTHYRYLNAIEFSWLGLRAFIEVAGDFSVVSHVDIKMVSLEPS